MGLFGKKKKSNTVDFTRMADASIPQVNKDYQYEGDAVDLRREKSSSSNSNVEVIDPFAGVSSESASSDSSSSSSSGGMFGFLDSTSTGSSSSSTSTLDSSSNVVTQVSEISEIKTRMRNMTSKMEESSNEVYRLMQRIELLEKKLERFENRGM